MYHNDGHQTTNIPSSREGNHLKSSIASDPANIPGARKVALVQGERKAQRNGCSLIPSALPDVGQAQHAVFSLLFPQDLSTDGRCPTIPPSWRWCSMSRDACLSGHSDHLSVTRARQRQLRIQCCKAGRNGHRTDNGTGPVDLQNQRGCWND